jgi:hypothetical protein
MRMINNLIKFILKYLSDENFRKLCESALNFSNSIDEHLTLYGANAQARSSKWPKVRDTHLKTDTSCNVCGSKEDLIVHHIIPFHVDKSKELDPNNLITLCNHNGCHFTFGHLFNWSSFNPNIIADAKTFKQKKDVANESI